MTTLTIGNIFGYSSVIKLGRGEKWWEEGQGGPTMHIGVGILSRTPKDSIPPQYPDYVPDLSFGLFLPFLLLPHPVS